MVVERDISAAFFAATEGYNPALSNVFAQEFTNVLSGNKPVQGQQEIKPNVITAVGEEAAKKVDVLAQETKKSIQSTKTTETFSADKLAPTKSSTDAKKTNLPSTSTGSNENLPTETGAPTEQPVNEQTTEKKAEIESKPTDAEIDSGNFSVPGNDDDLLEKVSPPAAAVAAPVSVQPIVVMPIATKDSINFQTSVFIFIGLAAAIIILILFLYMHYTNKTFSETWQTIKDKFNQVFTTKNKVY